MTDRLLADVTVPVRIVSELNARDHWGKKARRMKLHRRSAYLLTVGVVGIGLDCPRYRVLMTRIAERKLDEGDNLNSGFKGLRDGIADALGIDDGSERIEWCYAQESAGRGVYAARVQIWEVV